LNGRSKHKVAIPEEHKSLAEWILALIDQGLKPPKIIQKTGCSKSYAWRLYKEVQDKKEEKAPQPPEVEVEEVTKKVPEIPVEEPPTEITLLRKEEIREAIEEGIVTEKEVGAIFQAINDLLPTKYKRPREAIELLGSIWETPLNRILDKYMEENTDIFIALIVTIIVFSPSIKGVVTDAMKKKKEQEEKTKP